ncbi:MAG TPA: transcriptional repressor [Thioalkalivibrio sp.]|nr:transcriptional repressor [Thioalkalivibrio sp.]
MAVGEAGRNRVEERVSRIVQQLRASGHRITPQRVAIIRHFVGRTDHPSAEDIHTELLADYPMMALSTVYGTLRLLAEMGEAVEVSPATHETRFDPDVGDHCHLTCLACNRIMDLPMDACVHAEDFATAAQHQGFQPVRQVYQVFGYCADCRRDREAPSRA